MEYVKLGLFYLITTIIVLCGVKIYVYGIRWLIRYQEVKLKYFALGMIVIALTAPVAYIFNHFVF